jgi:NADPH-dependent 2,4-dienoyl-CoA reductase/sulfur reductase-like enzyme
MHLVAIGGSDAGISAALRARELDPGCEVTVVVADAYPNFSICGIPDYVSGEVTHWRNVLRRGLDNFLTWIWRWSSGLGLGREFRDQ